MKLIKNIKALSKISLIILLIASLIIGAFLSYIWVMGYYLNLEINIPKKTTLTISNVTFTNQSTGYFNATFLNPSYSPKAAKVTGVSVKTADNTLHSVTEISPTMPYTIPRAQNTTFQCTWDWANYTGQNIGVIAFIDDGSGPTYETETPFVGLTITEVQFNSSISINQFNITVQNAQNSATDVNITYITMPTGDLPSNNISPSLPYKLDTNKTQTFRCTWNWTDYQNKSIPIIVYTLQGYTTYYTKTTPKPLTIEITKVNFSEPDITHFNVTVTNKNESSGYVDLNKITVTLENESVTEVNRTLVSPALPYRLSQNSTITLKCLWNWTDYRGKSVTVSIFTAQNHTIQYTETTPSPIEITDAIFNAADTNNFNITVHNSAYYTHVNITNIILTFENGTIKEINGTAVLPQLPYNLTKGSDRQFKCPWDWTGYQGRNVTITVRTEENYVAQLVKVTRKRVILTITSISFDTVNTGIFEVTIRNSEFSLENSIITKVTLTFENGTIKETPNITPLLPYSLGPSLTVKLTCQWDWVNYCGKNITITIYAEKGYVTSSLYTTPPIQ